ncbi:MAG TPA: transporter substrate-binding protein, partial [Crenalkalicoccus sp.]|nr:transporter substrate-binding protein [Crenalkalicoccus sp.]
RMWTQAVAKAGTTNVDAVRAALTGQKLAAPCGYEEAMLPNHHLSKPVLIGEIQGDGQFNIVWKTPNAVPAENWSQFIPENANRRRG